MVGNPHSQLETIRRHMHIYNTELKDCGKTAPKELPIMKEIFCAKDKKSAVELMDLIYLENIRITQSGDKIK